MPCFSTNLSPCQLSCVLGVQGMRESYAVYMETLHANLGSAPPVPAATMMKRVEATSADTSDKQRTMLWLAGATVALLVVLLLMVWSLGRTLHQQHGLITQLQQEHVATRAALIQQTCNAGVTVAGR